MNTTLNPEALSRLTGWKRIAAHLGCSERTARRWEAIEGLPIHRQQHERRSLVFALPSELDAWIASRTEPSAKLELDIPSQIWRPAKLATALMVLLLVVLGTSVAVSMNSWPSYQAEEEPLSSIDPIAIDLYKRGVAVWKQRGEAGNRQAIALLSSAVKRDESFGEAWAALAAAWLTYPTYVPGADLNQAVDEALLAAGHAIALNPDLVEPRSVMAINAQRQGDWIAARRIFEGAYEYDTNSPTIMLWLAEHYRYLGLIDQSKSFLAAARSAEPNSAPVLTEMAMNHYYDGELEHGLNLTNQLWFDLGHRTSTVWATHWFLLLEKGDFGGARGWIAETPLSRHESVLWRYVERMENDEGQIAKDFVQEIKDAADAGMPAMVAYHMLDLAGMSDAALETLEAQSRDGMFEDSYILLFPRGSGSWKSPRFIETVERIGYVDYWREFGEPDACASNPEEELCLAVRARR